MSDNTYSYTSSDDVAPKETTALNGEIYPLHGIHPIIQDTKADFSGLAKSGQVDGEYDDVSQPMSHFHSLFYDLFTWKFPKATGFFFLSTITLIFAFRYVNVLRYVFKASSWIFAIAAAVEIAGKTFGIKSVVSSIRPKRYCTIPREYLECFFEQLHELANFFVLEFQRVLFVENLFATLAAFVTSFCGYFLIKYIPLWTLLLLATITAFTAPLIYINNKELIDEHIQRASDIVNAQLESTKKVTGKYAEDAAARARATAADLQTKVQAYTGKTSPPASSPVQTKSEVPSTTTVHDYLSGAPNAPNTPLATHDYPKVPTKEPLNEPQFT